jgi:hypothetical protein
MSQDKRVFGAGRRERIGPPPALVGTFHYGEGVAFYVPDFRAQCLDSELILDIPELFEDVVPATMACAGQRILWARPIARQVGLIDGIERMIASATTLIGVDEVRYRMEVGDRARMPAGAFPIRRLTVKETRKLRRALGPTVEDLMAEVTRLEAEGEG